MTTVPEGAVEIRTAHVRARAGDLVARLRGDELPAVVWSDEPVPELVKFIYDTVGVGEFWWERWRWDVERWVERLDHREVAIAFALVGGAPCGFLECETFGDDAIEGTLLGVLKRYRHRHAARALIHALAERTIAEGRSWVEGKSGSFDDPLALPYYLSIGFEIYDETVAMVAISDLGPLAARATSRRP